MTTQKSFLSEQYSKCWKFIKEARWFVVAALGIFATTFLIGFTFPIFFKTEILKLIQSLIAQTQNKTAIKLIIFIFLNNAQVALLSILLGILFGIFPLATAITNGYLLGFVARETASLKGISILWKLLPHGIFELPAIMLSIGIGMKIGTDIFKDNAKQKLGNDIKEGLRFFVFVIIPLLLVAGIIEGVLIRVLG